MMKTFTNSDYLCKWGFLSGSAQEQSFIGLYSSFNFLVNFLLWGLISWVCSLCENSSEAEHGSHAGDRWGSRRRQPGGWRRKPGPAGVRGWPGQPRQRGCCFRCRPRSSGCRAGPALFPKAGKPTMRIHPKRAFPVRVGGRDCPWVPGPRYRTSPWGGWEGAHSERQCPGRVSWKRGWLEVVAGDQACLSPGALCLHILKGCVYGGDAVPLIPPISTLILFFCHF